MLIHFDYDVEARHDIFDSRACGACIAMALVEGWQAMEDNGAIPGSAKIHSLFPLKIADKLASMKPRKVL
jgi:hypothetical protein